jgi:hypothetical protein
LRSAASQDCITCDLWDITNPGENIKCQECLELQSAGLKSEEVKTRPTSSDVLAPGIQAPEETPNPPIPSIATHCACESHTPGKIPGESCATNIGLLSPVSPIASEIRRSRAGRSSKLSAVAVKRLQSWLDANRDHPYPTPEAKAALAQACGITVKQVCTWFTNTRARHLKVSDDYRSPTRAELNEAHTPCGSTSEDASFYSSEHGNEQLTNTPHRSPVGDSGHAQLQPSRRGRKKDYRRNNNTSPAAGGLPLKSSGQQSKAEASETITWQCTFCSQSLAPKSWRRHEETQHRPRYTWICLASGLTVVPPSRRNSLPLCAFCGLQNPTADHCDNAHRMLECAHKPEDERTFLRPDHLRQHVKNFHKSTLSEKVRDLWRRDGPGKNKDEGWQCGFCDDSLPTWDIRETHIAGHFKDGLTMAEWKKPTTDPPCGVESEDAAYAHAPSDFDLAPFPDFTGWDFDAGNHLNFGTPPIPTSSMQQLIIGSTYDTFPDPVAIDTNFGMWPCNAMNYQEPW